MSRLCLLLALLLGACAQPAAPEAEAGPDGAPVTATGLAAPSEPRVQGMTLDAPGRPAASPLPELAALGVREVVLIPFAFMSAPDAPGLRFSTDANWYSESEAGARELAAQADSLGLTVVLKPQVWLRGSWPGAVELTSEADWQAWEAAYRDFAMHYARLAAQIESPWFVLGTELDRTAVQREAFWRSLIAEVRAVFPGRVTYAANWYEGYDRVPFWDALDAVGVQAYFPLAESAEGSRDAASLAEAWIPHIRSLQALADSTGRPVLFTEVGYRSVGYAHVEPWRWPERGEDAPPDPALQAALYEAFFEAVWNEPWCAGAILWKWPVPAAEGSRRRRRSYDPATDLTFSLRGKPAERVVARRWARP